MLLNLLLRHLSPAGSAARLSTLVLHRVLPAPDPLQPDSLDAVAFDRLCSWVRQHFNVLPLTAAVQRLEQGTLPQRALCVTFDDGYADNHDVALPILQRHGLSAAFFVTTGVLDGGCMWNDVLACAVRNTRHDRLKLHGLEMPGVGLESVATPMQRLALMQRLTAAVKYLPAARREAACAEVARVADVAAPRDLMLTSTQVRALYRAGMCIGSHTHTHPILAELEAHAIRTELRNSRSTLERLLDASVDLLAYPNGKWGPDVDSRCVQLAQECGFRSALTTDWGTADHATHRMLLPRFTPWDRSRLKFVLRMAHNLNRCAVRTSAGLADPSMLTTIQANNQLPVADTLLGMSNDWLPQPHGNTDARATEAVSGTAS